MDPPRDTKVDHYGAQYGNFATRLYAEIRQEAFGEDIGQNGWLTAAEQDLFVPWLNLSERSALLDLACGSGRPTLRIAERTGCRVCGLDLHAEGIANAARLAASLGLEARASFQVGNAALPLPFADASFDALTCIDAINHLPDRRRVLAQWRRVLKIGGRLLFTDPIVLTGAVSSEEIALRASIGFFLFVPRGLDEALLKESGFIVMGVENRTANMAENAAGWLAARKRRETELRRIEGDAAFDGQQRFLETAAALARDGRLSRFAILAQAR
ncbi:MAG TPA: methyltransferase domain-containing protein [Kiloniellales bacterium]|nr:methyltransferase domain-containing protein [Kiloniellales bacterium]